MNHKYCVIADDLTGANGTAMMLVKAGLKTIVNCDYRNISTSYKCDCMVVLSDTRCLSKARSINRIDTILNQLDNSIQYGKRTDSTLRGNISLEIDYMLKNLPDDVIACVVPFFPDMNRVVVNDTMYVDGLLLENTEAANDALMPVETSLVSEIILKDTKFNSSSITHLDINNGLKYLVAKIKKEVKNSRILIFDGKTNDDIDLIVKAVIESNIKFISVDPGPFTSKIFSAKERLSTSNKLEITETNEVKNNINKKVVAVVGTTNKVTYEQLKYLETEKDVILLEVKTKRFFEGDAKRDEEINRICQEIISHSDKYSKICIYGEGIVPGKKLDFVSLSKTNDIQISSMSKMLNNSFAQIVKNLNDSDSTFSNFFTSGGDITIEVCKKFDVKGIVPLKEIMPLAVLNELVIEGNSKINLISKGGMVGNKDAIRTCLNAFFKI